MNNHNTIDNTQIEVHNEIINNMKAKFNILKYSKEDSINTLKEDIEMIEKILKLIEKWKKEPDIMKKEKWYQKLMQINRLGVDKDSILFLKLKEIENN